MRLVGWVRRTLWLLTLCSVMQGAQATLIIDATAVAQGGGVFRYAFSVTNPDIDDVVLVTLRAPAADPLIAASLVAPAGFLALYDELLGFIDFVEGALAFSQGSTIDGFGFDAMVAPGSGFLERFLAIDVAGRIQTGRVNYVPEPAIAALVLLALALALLPRRRRRMPRA